MSHFYNIDVGKMKLGSAGIAKAYLGSTLVFQDGGSPTPPTPQGLPTGYTELQYVEFTAAQYVDLGVTPNNNWKIVAHFNRKGTAAMWLYGVETSSGNHNLSVTAYFGKNSASGNWRWKNTYASMTTATGEHTSTQDSSGVVKDGTTYSYGAVPSDFTAPTTLALGGMHYGNNTYSSTYFKGYVYSFKIYVSDVLTMDLVPCKDPNNVVGFYDVVGRAFYDSDTATALVAGPVKQ